MTSSTFTVTGMTCQHCVTSVTTELSELEGVTEVSVNLENGHVTIESEGELDTAQVEAAVSEAGYHLS